MVLPSRPREVPELGWSQRRITDGGKERWRACYRDARGVIQSAGTYSTEAKADKAWQREEAKSSMGRAGDPRRGRRKFETYVNETWLPNHVMEISTREGYEAYAKVSLKK
jgi:hypothetical protein